MADLIDLILYHGARLGLGFLVMGGAMTVALLVMGGFAYLFNRADREGRIGDIIKTVLAWGLVALMVVAFSIAMWSTGDDILGSTR